MQRKVVVIGASGQLGRELVRSAPPGMECIPLDRGQFDIGDPRAAAECLDQWLPQLVVNAAAYTAVDTAESDIEACRRTNADGPAQLAEACRHRGVRLLHVSTDFVFDGQSATPYAPDASTSPQSEYGSSKLAGELAVRIALPEALIMRTAWVYSIHGSNFVKTMLQLMAQRDELAVVDDQVGTPTWARGLAQALWAAAARSDLHGIYHWTDAGVCSWYDFAVAICEEACRLGILSRPVKIRPIPTSAYPTPARRPAYSVLDKSNSWRDLGLEAVHWRQQLRAMLLEFKELEDD